MGYKSLEELEVCKASREFRKKTKSAIPIEISPQLPNQPNQLDYLSLLDQLSHLSQLNHPINSINYSAQSTKAQRSDCPCMCVICGLLQVVCCTFFELYASALPIFPTSHLLLFSFVHLPSSFVYHPPLALIPSTSAPHPL